MILAVVLGLWGLVMGAYIGGAVVETESKGDCYAMMEEAGCVTIDYEKGVITSNCIFVGLDVIKNYSNPFNYSIK